MAKKILVISLVLVIALGGWLAYSYSDKEVIKRQLGGLAMELGKEGQEPLLPMALKMRKVKNMLSKSCLVRIPEMGYSETLEQDLIIRYLIYHRNRFDLFTVAFTDVVVDIPAKGVAAVQGTVRVRHRDTAETESVEENHHVDLALAKVDKKWLFREVTMPEALLE